MQQHPLKTRLAAVMLLAAATCAAAMPHSQSDSMIRDMEIVKKCNYTSPVAKDVLNSALINKILLDSNNYAFKCFLHCLYREYGWMDHRGEFQLKPMKVFLHDARLPISIIRKLLLFCTDTESRDKCDRAYDYTQCFWGIVKKPQLLEEGQDDPFGVSDDFETPYHLLDDEAN
ncbi:uncharacterized protein LOC132199798 [Neocloeon triangulifer]|uniref:uncharacterized protein LOC132199798 n=1 Tax=Neocloeon triangulifer TaxID=2078957 RepID=UPI00286F3404|nr:uncharacterized protein LOC132199798 [Neocloeon triangulifer]